MDGDVAACPRAERFGVVGDAKRDERFLRTFEIALRRMSAGLNETHTTTEIQGGALWKRPGEYKLGMLEQLGLIPAFASITGWSMASSSPRQ